MPPSNRERHRPRGKPDRVSRRRSSRRSACVTLEPIPPKRGPDRTAEVVETFRTTLGNLQAGRPVDPRLSFDDLSAYRELVAPLERRAKGVWLDGVSLTTEFAANIDRIIGNTLASEGFVTGRLERINIHNRHEFGLYPPLGAARVTCRFEEPLLPQVQAALGRNVRVAGRLSFRPERAFPEHVLVKSIEVLPADSELPTLAELRGSAPGCTGGLSSVEFVRMIRSE